MAVPADPRTPKQRVTDQLAAARRALTQQSLSRPQRHAIADRIYDLEQEARRLDV